MSFFAPEHENDAFCVARNRSNHMLSELLPAFLLVRVGLTLLHGQDRVEQEYTLLRPRCQIAVDWARSSEVHIFIVLQGTVNLKKTRRSLDLSRNGKAHSHRLIVLDVGILPNNDNLKVRKSRLVESIENQVLWREASRLLILALHILEEIHEGCAF